MCPRLSPRMAPPRAWLLWLLLPLSSWTQKLPTRDEELFQMQLRDKAFFHDSSVIPDGAEISSYLFRDTPKRYSSYSTLLINMPPKQEVTVATECRSPAVDHRLA